MANEDRLLTVTEVAEWLRVHPITVRRHIKAGELRAIRVGRAVRVREADLEEYLDGIGECGSSLDEKTSTELIQEARRIVRSIRNVRRPHGWPPTNEEMERRKKLTEEIFRRRDERGPIGITTQELVRRVRRERDEKHDRTSGLGRRRVSRRKMVSDRREPHGGS